MFSRTWCPPAFTPPHCCIPFECMVARFSVHFLSFCWWLACFCFSRGSERLWIVSGGTRFSAPRGITASTATVHVGNDGIYHYMERLCGFLKLATSLWAALASVPTECQESEYDFCSDQEPVASAYIHPAMTHTQVCSTNCTDNQTYNSQLPDCFLLPWFILCLGVHSTSCFILIDPTVDSYYTQTMIKQLIIKTTASIGCFYSSSVFAWKWSPDVRRALDLLRGSILTRAAGVSEIAVCF